MRDLDQARDVALADVGDARGRARRSSGSTSSYASRGPDTASVSCPASHDLGVAADRCREKSCPARRRGLAHLSADVSADTVRESMRKRGRPRRDCEQAALARGHLSRSAGGDTMVNTTSRSARSAARRRPSRRFGERLGLGAGAVVDGDVVARRRAAGRHGVAHPAGADPTDAAAQASVIADLLRSSGRRSEPVLLWVSALRSGVAAPGRAGPPRGRRAGWRRGRPAGRRRSRARRRHPRRPAPSGRSARRAGRCGRAAARLRMLAKTLARDFGSSPIDGSSSRIRLGSRISVRASSTCFCSPPDSEPACSWARSGADRERLGGRPRCGLRTSRWSLIRVAAHEQVVPDRHRREQAAILRHVHDAAAQPLPRRRAGDVLAAKVTVPARGAQQAADALEHGRLAGAVRTDEAGDRALRRRRGRRP